jgi:hypothetical protein
MLYETELHHSKTFHFIQAHLECGVYNERVAKDQCVYEHIAEVKQDFVSKTIKVNLVNSVDVLEFLFAFVVFKNKISANSNRKRCFGLFVNRFKYFHD